VGGGARSGVSDADRKPVPGGGKKTHKGGSTPIPADQIPSWETPTSKVIERAATKNLPLLILFGGEEDESAEADYIWGKEIVALAKEKAVFVRVPYNSDREPSWETGSPIPTSKILGKNPSRDYGIKSYPTMLVTDAYGNEFYRVTTKPDAGTLKRFFENVAEQGKKTNEKLQKVLDAAKKSFETKDAAKTLKGLIDNFRTGVVGLAAQEESIKLYHKVLEGGREELKSTVAAGGKDLEKKLKDLKKVYKDTELNKEIDAALKDAK
jgi:hypothetical protein